MKIVVAPLSNDYLRDWPMENYRRLVGLCTARPETDVYLLGAPDQRVVMNTLVRGTDATRVVNLAGRQTWRDARWTLLEADAVVANNSGIAHLAARMGRPTLCIFTASHDPFEWMARGPAVTTLFTRTRCAPCTNSGPNGCPFGRKCLLEITPEIAFAALCDLVPALRGEASAVS
jgi:heptosyltransferase-3